MSAIGEREIGGYFGLELPPRREPCMPGALRLQSARGAFAALLPALSPPRVWMPKYICDSMIAPLRALGIATSFYGIDDRLHVQPGLELGAGDLLLYVNYFGLSGEGERDAIARFGAGRVILDRAQAFFAPARECLAAIYSPRKFFGVPDGGLLTTSARVPAPAQRDSGSVGRSAHLLMRHDGPAGEGYPHFRRAEESLEDVTPRAMSSLTARILDSIDMEAARRTRVANFSFLHERLGRWNDLSIGGDDACRGPLCYPLLVRREGLRELLIENNVFVPTYWPEVISRGAPPVEANLARHCVALPCDQRYSVRDLERAVGLVAAALKPSHIGSAK